MYLEHLECGHSLRAGEGIKFKQIKNFTLPYVFALLLRCPISSSLSRLGGAAGGSAVRGGVCVCVTATSVTATRDHWVCIINNEGALKSVASMNGGAILRAHHTHMHMYMHVCRKEKNSQARTGHQRGMGGRWTDDDPVPCLL